MRLEDYLVQNGWVNVGNGKWTKGQRTVTITKESWLKVFVIDDRRRIPEGEYFIKAWSL